MTHSFDVASFCRLFKLWISAGIIMLSMYNYALAQTEDRFIATTLSSHGFVNVSVVQSGNTLMIAYENRRYRSEARGLAEVIRLVMPFVTKQDTISFMVRHLGKPLLVTHMPAQPLRSYLNGDLSAQQWMSTSIWTMDTEATSARLSNFKPVARPTLRSIDIPIGLGVRYVFGNFGTLDDNYRVALDLEPEVRLDLPLGFNAVARMSVPLHNNLDDNNHIRPSLIALAKPLYFKGPTVASIQAGIFSMNRLGVHAKVRRYFFEGTFSMGFDAGYTDYTDINGHVQVPTMEKHTFTTALLSANWRYRPYDLDFGVSYGQFLYQDNGVRVDINRSVGDSRIGFFAMETDLGRNLGFQFAFSIPPRRYAKPIPIRVRPSEYMNLSYRFAAGDRVGRMYDTGNHYFGLMHLYDPSHVKRELLRYLKP
jgi:hypothetical protein